MKHEPPMLVATRVYLQRGWKPVPIESGEKAPTLKDWPTIVITPEEAPRYFNGGNVGIRLGRDSGGLVDIDLDCSEAMILAPQFLPPTGAVFGRRSKPCSHQLYVSDLCDTEARAAIQYKEPRPQGGSGATLVELRIGGGAKGAQTVFPPSTHPSGESIIWVDEGEPAKVDGATLKRAVAKLAAACLLLRHYPGEGSRHEAALVLGGLLARGGWTGDAIEEFVTVIANTALDHEAHDRAKSAAAAVDLLARGGAVPGLPRMAELWGKTVAETVVKWLNIPVKVTDDYQREEEQQPAAPVASANGMLAMTRNCRPRADGCSAIPSPDAFSVPCWGMAA